jgi:hypothetical protein
VTGTLKLDELHDEILRELRILDVSDARAIEIERDQLERWSDALASARAVLIVLAGPPN